MRELTVLSPAKVNLSLRVLGARGDGLHDIESTVQPVSIFDEVRVRVSERRGVRLRADSPQTPADESNTAFAAAKLFMEEAGIGGGADIFLKKNIPAGAGLGGGSGNAAAVLAGLNRIFRAFTAEDLRRIGGRVGADVPLFIGCRACRVSGAGGEVEHLDGFPLFHYVVCFPGRGLATADVYREWDGLGSGGKTRGEPAEFRLPGAPVETVNDLEPAAFSLCPALRDFRDRLASVCGAAFLMTGSGSAFFSVFEDPGEARAAFDRAGGAGDFERFLARGVDGWREKTGGRFSAGV